MNASSATSGSRSAKTNLISEIGPCAESESNNASSSLGFDSNWLYTVMRDTPARRATASTEKRSASSTSRSSRAAASIRSRPASTAACRCSGVYGRGVMTGTNRVVAWLAQSNARGERRLGGRTNQSFGHRHGRHRDHEMRHAHDPVQIADQDSLLHGAESSDHR